MFRRTLLTILVSLTAILGSTLGFADNSGDAAEGRRQAHRRLPIWLLLAFLTLGPTVVLAQTYTTIDCPDAFSTASRSINDRGEVVGICEDANGVHGFLLRNGRFTLIDVPGGRRQSPSASTIGATWSDATPTAQTLLHGFLLRHGRFTTIDPPGSVLTVAGDIDDLGRIVGFYLGSDDVSRGFILDARGFQDIEYPDAVVTGVFDINALKRIVGGYHDTSGVLHGFLLKKGVFTSIDPPGAAGARAFGINIFGHIVGGWTDDPECPDCFTRAFLLTPGGFETLRVPGRVRDRGLWHQHPRPDRGRVPRGGRSLTRIPARPRRRLRLSINRRGAMGGTLGLERPAISLACGSEIGRRAPKGL